MGLFCPEAGISTHLTAAIWLDVANPPQLREGSAAFSEQQKEGISKWVDRVLEQRADWLWNWTERAEEPAWNDNYQWLQ